MGAAALRPESKPWLAAGALSLAQLLLGPRAQAFPPPPPPPPPPPTATTPRATTQTAAPSRGQLQPGLGSQLVINGQRQTARWLWQGPGNQQPQELWIPLEVLQGQLGVTSRSRPDGGLELEWFGQPLTIDPGGQRSLDDEVAVNVAGLLAAVGVGVRRQGSELHLQLPMATLLQVRSANQGNQRRVVLDLNAAAFVRASSGDLELGLSSTAEQRQQLAALGLASNPIGDPLQLRAAAGKPNRVFTLGDPPRVVIDLPLSTGGPAGNGTLSGPSPTMDPRLKALLGQGIQWDRMVRQGVRINAVRIDPRTAPVSLRPLTRPRGGDGLSSVQQLADTQGALVAINGGYFNRVKRLPLGAIKSQGQWLSGPILNRGVAAWSPGSLPRFGRLSLEEWVIGPDGDRLPVLTVNSGYVQRGISRYGAEWGPSYRALSGGETGLLVSGGVVRQTLQSADLEAGVPLRPGDLLLVGRGGVPLPWSEGSRLRLTSRASNDLGLAPFVIGGGPLLLQDGVIVLNGAAETFSSGFLTQGAPRTVIGSDGNQVWLITMEGTNDSGPTLLEAAQLLQQLGLRDALNLDGGSSTGLVMGGTMPVKGRGVVGAVHNGLGLVP